MLIINKLSCRNSATMVLQHSTKFTTTTIFLQKGCFFYNVENIIKCYIIVNQCFNTIVELVENVEAWIYPSFLTDILVILLFLTYFCVN